jgi:filamentous hemagglutinin family protein
MKTDSTQAVKFSLYLIVQVLGLVISHTASAEIATDGTLGPATSLAGPNFSITADLGQQQGGNLFHSFSTFNINTGESATFSGPVTVNNILGRVTGGSASNIDGLLRSTIPGANLYLLNPSGVIFGDNASLDIGGSFYVSTADYLKLGNSGRFDASNPGNSVLVTAPPSAFGFLGNNPASISTGDSLLQTQNGKTLALVGGDINITDGNLYAPDGQVALVSVASTGEVPVDPSAMSTDDFESLGSITVANPSGEFPFIGLGEAGNLDVTTTQPGDAAGGGSIVIRGGEFRLEEGLMRAEVIEDIDGGGIDVAVSGTATLTGDAKLLTRTFFFNGDAGPISIKADSLVIGGDTTISSDSSGAGNGGTITVKTDSITATDRAGISSDALLSGNGGSIQLTTNSLDMTDDSVIKTSTFGSNASGDAGNIVIHADNITMAGDATINSSTELGSQGAGGQVTIQTDVIELHEEAWIISYTETTRDAGEISIGTNQLTMDDQSVISTTTFASGNGGTITINTGQLTLADEAIITSGTEGTGNAGDVIINVGGHIDASDSTTISSESEGGNFFVRGGTDLSAASGGGDGGLVRLTADRIDLSGDTIVASGTAGAGTGGNVELKAGNVRLHTSAGVSAVSTGEGNAGNVTVSANDSLEMNDQSTISTATFASGTGGTININANQLTLAGEAIITSGTEGSGNAGDVIINAAGHIDASDSTTISSESEGGNFFVRGGMDLSAASGGGDGGLVRLTADRISLSGGAVVASGTAGTGAGGNVELQAGNIRLQPSSGVSAVSTGEGNAGNISVSVNDSLRMKGGSIRTRAVTSDGGNITITAPNMVYLLDSEITTSVESGLGDGGNISIDPEFVILNNSRIVANAFDGDGGNILIVTENFIATPDSVVDASSRFGLDGTVIIKSPVADLSSGLTELPESFLNVAALLREPCSARRSLNQSSFIVRGRSAIPPGPMSLLPVMGTRLNDTAASSDNALPTPAQQLSAGTGITLAGLSSAPFLASSLIECGL